jgi:ubiquinone/menaquinone biosynthesis C-methylase UbiE
VSKPKQTMVSAAVEKYSRFCESSFGDRLMTKEADYLRKELKGRRHILDVGCGIGTFEQKLAELAISGVDRDAEMLNAASARTTNTYCRADAAALPFRNASFDAVIFVTSMEFMDDYKAAIDEAARVLEPEGNVVVMVLNPESDYFKGHYAKEGSYFRLMKHKNLRELVDYSVLRFEVRTQYFLGIDGDKLFDTPDKAFASLFLINGIKK